MRELENRIKRAVMADGPLPSPADSVYRHRKEPQSLGIRAARARAEREVLQLARSGRLEFVESGKAPWDQPVDADLMQQHQIGLDA
jgi:hypothetical protein